MASVLLRTTQKKTQVLCCCWNEPNRCSIRDLVGIFPLLGALQLWDGVEEMILCNLCYNCFCADSCLKNSKVPWVASLKTMAGFLQDWLRTKASREHLWAWSAAGSFTPFETPGKQARTQSPIASRAQGTPCPQATICNFNLGKSKGGSVVCTTYLNLFPNNNYCSL